MPRKLLVVEDNADARIMLETLLSQEGFIIVTAEDGQDGLEKARAELPHLVLTDLHMPGLNGFEMIECMRQIPVLSKTPIIVLTADVDAHEKAILAGADSVLIKPLLFEELIKTIKRLLGASFLLIADFGFR